MLALIAVANVMIYLHARPYGLRQHLVDEGPIDRLVTATVVLLVDGRAYPLFAALFGYGLVRIAGNQAARGAGASVARAVVRRRCWLLVLFGSVHALLAFSGDILGWYGLIGVVLAGRLHVSDRVLVGVAAGWLVFASALQGWVYADPQVRDQRSFLWSFAIEDPGRAAAWRAAEWLMTPVGLLAVVSPVLLGVWAARRGVLEEPDCHRALLRGTAVAGIGVGVVGGVGMALATVQLWTPSYLVLVFVSWAHVVTGVFCGLGYAAAIALWADRLHRRHGSSLPCPVWAMTAAGRRSLSCYLAQSVVFAVLLPAWSLGWGATVGSAGASVVAIVTWVGTVGWAVMLERAGRPGPAEALQQRVTYGRSHDKTARARIVPWR